MQTPQQDFVDHLFFLLDTLVFEASGADPRRLSFWMHWRNVQGRVREKLREAYARFDPPPAFRPDRDMVARNGHC